MRVIAGEFGGRRLVAPRGLGTRPTSDRVREALFMMLEPLAGLYVVDLFAGSGALGIEALSRGAARVDFVEPDRGALAALKRNLESLDLAARSRVWPLRWPGAASRMRETLAAAQLVVADPPYGGEVARAALAKLGEPGLLRSGARVVMEHHAKDELPERCGCLERARVRRYGETAISTFRTTAGNEPRDTHEERR